MSKTRGRTNCKTQNGELIFISVEYPKFWYWS